MILLALVTPANATQVPSAATLFQTALTNLSNAPGVHYSVRITVSGDTQTIIGNAGRTSGSQALVVNLVGGKVVRADIKVIGNIAYLNANSTFYVESGLTTKTPPAGTWLSIKSSDKAFQAVPAAVTTGSLGQQIALTGPYSYGGTSKINGVKVEAIKGATQEQTSSSSTSTTTFPETVWIRATGTPVPLLVTINSRKVRETATLSHYGEKVNVAAPQSSVPISQFGG